VGLGLWPVRCGDHLLALLTLLLLKNEVSHPTIFKELIAQFYFSNNAKYCRLKTAVFF
jgi:hypothetical protein